MCAARAVLFALLWIPITAATTVQASDGTVAERKHAYFGFGFNYAPGEKTMQLRICAVVAEGPAAQTDLRLGDAIVSVDGRKDFESAYDVLLYLYEKQPRETLKLDVRRGEKKLDVSITSREATKEEVERMLQNLHFAKQEKTRRVR